MRIYIERSDRGKWVLSIGGFSSPAQWSGIGTALALLRYCSYHSFIKKGPLLEQRGAAPTPLHCVGEIKPQYLVGSREVEKKTRASFKRLILPNCRQVGFFVEKKKKTVPETTGSKMEEVTGLIEALTNE